MSLTLHEENFIVIDVGSSVTRAGMGMHDTNKLPTIVVNMADFNYPIRDNKIVSWEDLEASWNHILFKEFNIKKSRNEHAVLLSIPLEWTKFEHERITQIFFERFNAPGIYIAPQPLLALYGCGSVSGMVVDVGESSTKIGVVVDSLVQLQASYTVSVGGRHFDTYLLDLLKRDASVVEQFKDKGVPLDLEFARFLKEQPGVCNVFVGHEKEVERPKPAGLPGVVDSIATAATEDVIEDDLPETDREDEITTKDIPEDAEVEYKGHKFTIGKYRHQALDPLFDPSLVGLAGPDLVGAMRLAASHCEPPEIRPKVWESVVLCGGNSLVTGLQMRLKAEVNRILPSSENIGDAQPRQLGFLRIPDYFTILKDRQYHHLCTWLGGEIVAKLVFIDAKNYISKVDYNESGPSVVHTKGV
ncbi:actin family [Dichotomocladium elegans]|nr:actin family [Dichotomocladium elegans]